MKVIIKIDEYLSERNSVVFKTCRLNSHKPIDEYEAKVVDCHDLNMTDCETFIESELTKFKQEKKIIDFESVEKLETEKLIELEASKRLLEIFDRVVACLNDTIFFILLRLFVLHIRLQTQRLLLYSCL